MLRNWEEKVMTIKGTHKEVELAINKIKANNRCKYNIIYFQEIVINANV